MTKETNVFSTKPFIFSDQIIGKSDKVYVPKRSVTIDEKDKNKRTYICVHDCDQFLSYPVTKWGIRVIPVKTQCKFGGLCHGSRLLTNGKPINRNVSLNYALLDGLTNSGR